MTSANTTAAPCILCSRPLRRIGKDFTGKEIFRCDACDYLSTPPATDTVATALYDNPEYFDGWGSNLEFDYARFEPAVHQQVSEYLEFIKQHTNGQSLLDVGTGSGLLPHMARAAGYEVEGTDLSKHVSDHVPAKAGFPIHHGTLEAIDFTRRYDIITMFHVLEHTTNPLSTMARAKHLLHEGGFVIVVVPNVRSLDTRIKDLLSKSRMKSRPYKHLALGHHNWVFSLATLQILGEKSGLRVVHRETRQPSWRAGGGHRLLERYQLATWCWIVYQKT